MKRVWLVVIVLAALAMSSAAGVSSGQAPGDEAGPENPASPAGQGGFEDKLSLRGEQAIMALVNSRISYEGMLRDGGAPVNGARNMTFQFFTASACAGSPVASVSKTNVPVNNGLFMVDLDVSQSLFNGQGLWLRVVVDSIGIGCQEVTPSPYALSLRPGAEIRGNSSALSLLVENTGTGDGIRSFANATGANYGALYAVNYGTGTGVYAYSSRGRGVYALTDYTNTYAVQGVALYNGAEFTTNYGGYFESRSRLGVGVYGRASYAGSGVKYAGRFECASETCTGVYAQTGGSYSSYAVRGEHTGTVADSGIGGWFSTEGPSNTAVMGDSRATTGFGVGGQFQSAGQYGTAVKAIATGANSTGLYASGGTNGLAAQFGGKVQLTNSSGATVIEMGEGLDYAEGFAVSDATGIVPGMVLVIDAAQPGKLALSSQPYDSRVAGVVAGANGLGSGVRLAAADADYDVALAGRVYCFVEGGETGVQPGDLLTTSATPGHAMKAADRDRAQGAILGKAMQPVESGQTGLILVLVALQ